MDIHALKQHIKNDENLIELVLEDAGFSDINGSFKQGDEFRCAWEDGSNPTAIKVNKYTLSATCFSRSISGDIITLVSAKLNLPLNKTLRRIATATKFTEEEQKEYELPFGGFFKKIHKIKKRKITGDLPVLSESTLDEYLIMPSSRFMRDGINYETQEKYQIGYDLMTDRIIIPVRNLLGDLVGVMGRLNKDDIEEWENKYFPLYAFPKSKVLFGFSQNYETIQQQSFVMLFESEKSVMRLDSFGVKNTLALGGSSLSSFQANNIKSLFPQRVLVCLDEGLDESVSYEMAKQLKIDTFFNNEVGYVYDSENKYLPKGSKMSPADLSLDKFKKLIVECSKKV